MIGIYKFTNRFDRKVYIGQSKNIERRYKAHCSISKKENDITNYFHNALRKYGVENFDFDVLIECPAENLNYWEKFYIKYYCSNDKNFGYNETDGGYSTCFSEEVLKKMSEVHKGQVSNMKGKHASEETRKKQSVSAKKRGYNRVDWHPSEEQRRKQSLLMTGRKESDETRHKKSVSLKGKNKGKHKVYDDEFHIKYHMEY